MLKFIAVTLGPLVLTVAAVLGWSAWEARLALRFGPRVRLFPPLVFAGLVIFACGLWRVLWVSPAPSAALAAVLFYLGALLPIALWTWVQVQLLRRFGTQGYWMMFALPIAGAAYVIWLSTIGTLVVII